MDCKKRRFGVMKTINPYKLFVGVQVPYWLMRRKEITPGAKLCYALLCRFAGRKGVVYLNIKTLAKDLACSSILVEKYLTILMEHNLLKKIITSDCYHFLDHEWITEENSNDPDYNYYTECY
jgi:hypothetical protein